jgi:glycosyltransferase involved in cell wall biosynthesis
VKILWHSNAPFSATGYGVQTAHFAPRIRDLGHDVAISSFYGVEGSMLEWNGMKLYPTDHTRFGKAMLPYYVNDHANGEVDPREVLVLTLMDVWALTDPKLEALRMASWVPVDHAPTPPRVREFFDITGSTPIAMSRFGEQALRDSGMDPLYVPHGVDTNIFKPVQDRAAAREALGVPEGAFVVGMVANNKGSAPPRKAFPQVFQAFTEFHRAHPEAILYLHTDVFGFDQGVNLMALAKICGVPQDAMACTDQFKYLMGVPAEQMASIYSMFDVLASPSYGEGFGVPIVEAQACGVPVITTDWTAMSELTCAGWKVDGDTYYDPPHGAFYKIPMIGEIYEALEAAYDARDDQVLRARGVEFAQGYDVDHVMSEFWVPVLEALDGPREVPPLQLNRQQRRAQIKATQKAA